MVTSSAVYNALLNKLTYASVDTFTDCDTAADGFLCAHDTAHAPGNTSGWIWLLTLTYNNDNYYKIQLCFVVGDLTIYKRAKDVGVWTEWRS